MKTVRSAHAVLLAAALLAVASYAAADGGAAHRAAQAFPVKLGTSGGNIKDISKAFCCSGTLGALVTRNGTTTQYVLSNNHVLARSGAAVVGEKISQPGLIDSGCRAKSTVATFSQAAALGGSNVDAAIALAGVGAVDPTGAILDVGVPASAAAVGTLGMKVAKSGRTTGLTCGGVGSVSTDVSVQYQRGCNSGKKFTVKYRNQLVVNSGTFSAGGDSGSLLVDAATAQPVALLFAGSSTTTIANPIQDVMNALNVSFVGGAAHAVTCPTASSAATGPARSLPAQAVERARAAKNRHAEALLNRPDVQGVGVGVTESDPSQPAVVLYVVSGQQHGSLPLELDGVATRVVVSDRFRATGWNEKNGEVCGRR